MNKSNEHSNFDLISIFVRHKVVANLLMFLMIGFGVWGVYKLNIQFLPTFKINFITISVPWPGATAADIERSVIIPLEKELKDISNLKKMSSVARSGSGVVILEYKENANMNTSLQQIQEKIASVSNLPTETETPIIKKIEHYEPIARVIISGPLSLDRLRLLAYQYQESLLRKGIAKIEIEGLPEQELAIRISIKKLKELQKSIPELAEGINKQSIDLPLGEIGKYDVPRELRIIKAVRSVKALEKVQISKTDTLNIQNLGDIAVISLRNKDGEHLVFHNGKPAIELRLLRTANENALEVAEILQEWYVEIKPKLGDSVQLELYDQNWLLIKDRINLLYQLHDTLRCCLPLS